MVNLVEWAMSIPAVQVVISSTLSIVALALLAEMTLNGSTFYEINFSKF